MDAGCKEELLGQLVKMLEDERGCHASDIVTTDDLWLQFRALVNVRSP